MVLFDGVLGLVMLGLWIFCIIDVITTPADRVRNLPKLVWLILVVLLVDIGSIAWLVAGHNWAPKPETSVAAPTGAGPRPSNPDDDEDFLAGLRARAEEQRKQAREQGPDGQPPHPE
ncbi:MAG TPA: PLDc N-terminal domain-containing protein [Jatrophihabitantaceae bacterium]|nr:PLDc N-terminal domain-containing protein [Jatrophihabitantaceae bacterium]